MRIDSSKPRDGRSSRWFEIYVCILIHNTRKIAKKNTGTYIRHIMLCNEFCFKQILPCFSGYIAAAVFVGFRWTRLHISALHEVTNLLAFVNRVTGDKRKHL